MAKYKIVHYLNQFFGGIGGEDKADFRAGSTEKKVIGPGTGTGTRDSGDDYEIVATVICGDNYFGENLDEATDTIVEMVKRYTSRTSLLQDRHLMRDVMVLLAVQFARRWKSDSAFRYVSGMYEGEPGS